ncbi:hypothetical protein BU23DRAFT_650222 [Bimuria novae-zelandiae CBS 107.79]|uniref:Uncharacterized protein n=1 Tax=Bimuria novae-zelandiae CBS 107.79 TaxID=1447943 RepID=A0A6A5V0U0_9PLEO|nr:hypothetical protein BU23DRAFT_650222 [Bimuria novae-zelandiae CBS 107.79]
MHELEIRAHKITPRVTTDYSPLSPTERHPNNFNIPRELRDDILERVLAYRRPSPQIPEEIEAQERHHETISPFDNAGWYLRDPSAYTSNSAGLLLACKKLCSENQEALARLRLAHELDIKFVNERYLAPTCTVMPAQTKRFSHVYATIQSVGGFVRTKHTIGTTFWRHGSGGPPLYVRIFYHPLGHFLERGCSAPHAATVSSSISVERLDLDFVDPEDIALLPPPGQYGTLYHARGARSRLRRNEDPELLRPELLAADLLRHIAGLFAMGYHTARYGSMLHGRIGELVCMINGEVLHRIDVGQTLADLKFNNSFDNVPRDRRLEKWIQWKKKAQEWRRECGLKMVAFEEGWEDEAAADADRIYARRI